MRPLSKSRITAFRQCPKRLWLEVHRPESREDSKTSQSRMDAGNRVGEIARQIYDPAGRGVLIDWKADGWEAAFARTAEALGGDKPIFEASFRIRGALVLADVLLPVRTDGERRWRMVEVKSSTSVKDYHREDVAFQTLVARGAGVVIDGVAVAHIDSSWRYPGGGDYRGLLKEEDVTAEVLAMQEAAAGWLAEAHQVVASGSEPAIRTGAHCTEPFDCGFIKHCKSQEPQAEYPVEWLPGRFSKGLVEHIRATGAIDMRDVPDDLLSDKQQRVKAVTLSGERYFDRDGVEQALSDKQQPAYFMDFETINFAVPRWAGTRPYQMVPFQFSVHHMSADRVLRHRAFLDLSGEDPSEAFARTLVEACAEPGPIFVYNAGFETARLRELAERFPDLAKPLLALIERVFDLLPVVRDHYYHPSQKGSWSIKAVLPAMCPNDGYDQLEGVKDGGMAMEAYLIAIAETCPDAKAALERQLLDYCKLDTFAMFNMLARIDRNWGGTGLSILKQH